MKATLKQLNTEKWTQSEAFAVHNVLQYRMGTIHGILQTNRKNIVVIGIFNDQKHNGDYLKFIEFMEKQSQEDDFVFQVSDFLNADLLNWFLRRGYVYNAKNDRVTYMPKRIEHEKLRNMLKNKNNMKRVTVNGRRIGKDI